MRIGSGTIATIVMMMLAGGLAAQDNDNSAKTEEHASSASTAQVSTVQASSESAQPAAQENGAMAGDSHVRIVRLSEAQGKLAMDRGTGKGYEQTMQNMPIVEGAKLQTDDGYAEVEFEDGSTMRLAPDSRVEFPQLVLRSSGTKASTVNVVRGTVYVNMESSKDNEFTLKAGQATMVMTPSTHLRVELTWPKTVVSVFSGNVSVLSGGAATMVGKKESATLDATDAAKVEVTKKVAESTYDGWDKQSVDYHKQYAARANAYTGGGGYGFGVSDLNYYGSFINAGGCGSMWQPYFTSAAWSPYGNGVWAWYQGAGYSWVSPYPWGWLPYHSGAWSYCSGYGWGWQPGGAWRGLNNVASGVFTGPGATGQQGLLPRPPGGPVRGPMVPASTLVLANSRPLVFSKESTPGNFVFQKDSAGLGVPRGSLGGLKGVSNDVGHHGFASMPVYAEPISSRVMAGHPMSSGPVTLRQGSPNGGGSGGSYSAGQSNGGATNSSGGSFHSGSMSASHAGGGMSGGGGSAGASSSGNSSAGSGSHSSSK